MNRRFSRSAAHGRNRAVDNCYLRAALEQLEDRHMLAADMAGLGGDAAAATQPEMADVSNLPSSARLVSTAAAEGEASGPMMQPLVLLPGILGSLPTDDLASWLTFDQQALDPENLQIDPVLRTYDDLIASLVDAGYNDGSQAGVQTLWAAPYDWRLPVAPRDGVADGSVDASQVDPTDTTWEFGIEYVHYWIDRARAEWESFSLDPALFSVDIVAHSMGGLLARSYVQSDLHQTGEIDQLLMLGTPNQGAVDAYQVREWINDVLDFLPEDAFQQLADGLIDSGAVSAQTAELLLAGVQVVNSPDVESYSPSLTDLLPTFEFISRFVPHQGLQGLDDNTLLADLNTSYDYATSGIDAQSLLGTGIRTDYELYQPLGLGVLNLITFRDLPDGIGDGTVLVSSARLPGVADRELDGVEHLKLAGADVAAQAAIFEFLGVAPPAQGYSSGAYRSLAEGIDQWLSEAIDYPWHNASVAVDVNGDRFVSPRDALWVINTLNVDGSRPLAAAEVRAAIGPYYDVNFDGFVSPRDALMVIRELNLDSSGDGEGVASAASLAAFVVEDNPSEPLVNVELDIPGLTQIDIVVPELPTGLPKVDRILERAGQLTERIFTSLEETLDDIGAEISERLGQLFD